MRLIRARRASAACPWSHPRNWLSRFPTARHDAFVALGYSKLNQLRAKECAAMKALGYRLSSYVSSRATVFPDFRAG